MRFYMSITLSLITLIFGLYFFNLNTSEAKSKLVYQKEVQIEVQNQIVTKRQIILADNDGSTQIEISDPTLDTYHPDISSSGNFVSYSQGLIEQGKKVELEIVIKDLRSNITEIWTERSNQNIHTEFSGNEQYLAFSGPNPKNKKQNIFVVDLQKERALGPKKTETLGSNIVQTYSPEYEVIESAKDCYAPAISSDGSFLIYHCTDFKDDKSAPKQLKLYNRSTKKEMDLTLATGHAMFPSLSSDDRFVAYVSKASGQWDIFVYDLWTKNTVQVTNDPEMEFTPYFKADNKIYFTRLSNSPKNEFLIDIYFLDFIFNKDSTSVLPQLDQDLSKTQDKNLNTKLAKPFLSNPDYAEYVISFSNSEELEKSEFNDFPLPERSSFGAVTYKDKVYIAGGHQGPEHTYPKESFLDLFQVYDIKSKTWSTLPSLHEAKHGFQIVAYNDAIYVFGGFTYSDLHSPKWKSVDTIEKFDLKTQKWSILPAKLLKPRSSNALSVVGNKAYIIGGWDSTPKSKNDKEGFFHDSVEVFDFETETIALASTTLPKPLRRAFTSVAVDSKIYLLGGIGQGASHFEWIDNVTVLNTPDLTWSETTPLPFPTFAPGAGVLKNKIFLTGGMILKDKESFDLNYVDDIYIYDLVTNVWTHSGVYLSKNKGFPQVVDIGNDGLGILGGHTYVETDQGLIDHPVSDFEVLEIK